MPSAWPRRRSCTRWPGAIFNVNSNAQLAQVLYTDLQLPVLKRGKTGPSTDAEVLEKLAEKHPLPRTLLEYRTLSKLKTHLPRCAAAADRPRRAAAHHLPPGGHRHRPALQLRPQSPEHPGAHRDGAGHPPGLRRRAGVEARLGRLQPDRAPAAGPRLRGPRALLEAFRAREDVHVRTAAEVFGVSPGEVTADQRRVAKMVNFGIAYGLSPHGLSTRLDIPHEEAASIIDRYFARYVGIRRYLEETVERARRTGSVETLFGRRRLMDDLHSSNRMTAQAAERAAINMPIQGTAADLIKMAMLRDRPPARASTPLRTRMLLQVHDELLFEAPEEELERAVALAREAMTGVAQLRVPLEVEVGVGASWADAH